MKRAFACVVGLAVLAPIISGAIGVVLGPWILRPMRKPLNAGFIAKADGIFARDRVTREEFDVRAPDGAMLRGWKVRARTPNGDWVLLFHGIVDNRASFSSLREVSYDYAGLEVSSVLGRTLFRPASYFALRSAENEGGFRADGVSPGQAVSERAFPVLLICGTRDKTIPCRHSEELFR